MQKWNKPWWSITKTAKKVAEHLALNPSITRYQISNNLAMPSSTAYKAIKELENRKLVFGEIDERWTRGQERKEYALNIDGFSYVVAFSNIRIDEICRNYKDLIPLVAGKWSLFQQTEIQEIAEKKLRETSINYMLDRKMPLPAPKDYGYSNTPHMFFSHVFYYPLYYNYKDTPMTIEEIKKWLTVCSKDEDVKKYMNRLMEGVIKSYLDSIKLFKNLKTHLK